MDRKNFRFFGVFLLVILMVGFVLALIADPIDLVFNENDTVNYDSDGTFSLNWTAGIGDDEANYTVWFSNDGGSTYTKDVNDSVTGYQITGGTDAQNYTFKVQAVNGTGTESANVSSSWIVVDTDTPVLIYSSVGTDVDSANKSQTWIFVNVTATDTNNDTLVFNLYYSNGTLVNSTSYSSYSPTQINWTSLAQAGYTYNVTANDSATNSNSTASRTITLDTTNPVVTLSKSSSAPTSLTISISGVDGTCIVDRNGASISGSTLTETSLFCGTSYSYVVTCTDSASNSGASSSTSFLTDACGGPVSSSSTTDVIKKVHSFSKITPGVASIVKNFDSDIGLKEIKIEVNNEAQNVRVEVKKYSEKPAAVSKERYGKVHKYLQITVSNVESKLSSATITIQVEKSWVSSNGLERDDIRLSKFNEDLEVWNELPTTFMSEDDTYYYYDSVLTSFSYFAIGEKTIITDEGEEVGVSDERIIEEAERGSNFVWIIIAIILVAAIIGGGVAYKKKQ